MKKRFIEIAVKMLVAALTAFLHGSRTRNLLKMRGTSISGRPSSSYITNKKARYHDGW